MDSRVFRECEGEGFQKVIDAVIYVAKRHKGVLEAKDLMPTAKTVSSHVTSQARALREKDGPRVKDILLNRGGCITLDGWTEDYTKTNLSEEDCKNVTFVGDAAPNMIKSFNLKNRAPMKRISCACHMLNTCLANAVNRRPNSQFKLSDDGLPVLKLFQQCKELVTYCKQAYLFRELSAAPKQSVDTRWNSNLDMLDSIIRIYEELGDLLQARDEEDKLPGPLGFLQAVADLLRPFKTATEALSAATSPTLQLVVEHFLEIRSHVKNPLAPEYHDLP
ncbi:hypothetical protein RvY_11316 [Ramazzottius varieornatus]|uniref:Uncharacterized protein n=1 Tax=Ramazzottius varieornatus TaxID=947166 RepID=A0A1D1VK33_RAMVA|nr:hypothetical protein RvY_11316 [Ramazzottius varieornatus]